MAVVAPAAGWRNLVGGEWRESHARGCMTIVNPADERPLAQVPAGTADDVAAAVAAARRAYESWRTTTPRERSELLHAIADVLRDNGEELACLESANAGKPLALARGEMASALDCLRFFAGAARTLSAMAAGEYAAGMTSMIRRDPLGVVAGIVPWNFPLVMAVWKLGPALAVGNTIVLKPAEATPLSLLRLLALAGDRIPAGVVNVVTGAGEEAGAALVAHPDVSLVSLTGDVETGRTVARLAADTLKRVHLELGGKAPVVVLDDADVDAVIARLAVAGYSNSGQSCAAPTRVVATPRVFGDVVDGLAEAADRRRVGDPAGADAVDLGPVISDAQRERVLGFVERSTAGAGVLRTNRTPAPAGPGYFVNPVVISGVAQDHEIVQREVFGPVITAQRAADDDEALRWANDVRYGLCASVWTESASRAARFARDLEFGTVWVNTHGTNASELPHGGIKESGYGKDRSIYALEDYSVVRHVGVRLPAL